MPSTYSSNLKLELMATGENSGTWGNITNTNLGTAVEQAIIGLGNVDYVSDANLTISITNSNAAQAARALVLNVTSSLSLTGTRELVVPTIEKQYIVQNNTTGGQSITVKTSAGTGITVPNGRKAHLYVNGTNVIQMFDFVDINGGTIDGTPIGGSSASTGAFTTLSASGAATFNGAVTLGDAAADLIVFNGTVNSHLLFTDNTYDIGASGATRPRNLFLAGAATIGGNLSVGGTLTLTGGLILNGNVTVGDSSADTLTVNATITSNLLFTDNTYDIGASGATRPRNLFLAGNAAIGGNTTMTGTLTVDSTTDSTSIITGSIQTDGGMGVAKALYVGTTLNVAGAATFSGAVTLGDAAADNVTVNGTVTSNLIFTDNTYDIGANGATRPRRLYLSDFITAGGAITSAGQISAAFGTYGSYSSPALLIGDGNYGLYVAGGNLLMRSSSGGQFSLMNSAGSASAVTLDVNGNVAVSTVSTPSGSATFGMLGYSGTVLWHGKGSSWTAQASYIGGNSVSYLTATGLAVGGVEASTSLEGYKEAAFGQNAGSTIRASTKDNYGSSGFGYGFYVQNTADEIAQILVNYADSGGFGRGALFFNVADPTNGLQTRAFLSSFNRFGVGASVATYTDTATNNYISAITTTDNYGLGVVYPTAPNGTAGGAFNFWAADNSSTVNVARIKAIVTDGAAGASGADMVFYANQGGTLTEWLRAFRGGQRVETTKPWYFGTSAGTPSGADVKVFAGYGLGTENGIGVFGTTDRNIDALMLTNWDGAQTTYGPRISFDNSGWGGIIIGAANGANRFDIASTANWGSAPWFSLNNATGYLGLGTISPAERLTLASPTANDAEIVLAKTNSGVGDQGGNAIRFWNYGPPNLARSNNVMIGEIYFGASQPSSGAIQDAAQIIVRADGAQTGPTTMSKMQFLTSTSASGGANTIGQVIYGDQTSVFGGESKGGGRITAYQSSTNSFVCSTADGDSSGDYGIGWYITTQGFTFARIKGVYESSGGTGQGRVVIQTKSTSGGLTDRLSVSSFGNTTIGSGNFNGGSGDPQATVVTKGYYYWGSANGLGDFYVGDGTYGLSVGIATGGGGAGTCRLWTQNNGTQALYLGAGNTDSLGVFPTSVSVIGSLSKGSGSFKIDHPLPQLTNTHHLVHSFIEGPQADLIYRGKVNLVAGRAEVNIDTAAGMTEGTFVALCRDVQCFTTNESDWTAVRGSVVGNILTIEAQDQTSTANISWMVIGERQDKHMYDTGWTDNDGKVIVEPVKTPIPD